MLRLSNMKLILAVLVLVMVVGAQAQWYNFPREAIGGARDMWRAYQEMIDANYQNSDKYFHARGNYDAAQRGPGGKWAAEVISDGREGIQRLTGHGHEDSEADQRANNHGRNGGNLNIYRPQGLDPKY